MAFRADGKILNGVRETKCTTLFYCEKTQELFSLARFGETGPKSPNHTENGCYFKNGNRGFNKEGLGRLGLMQTTHDQNNGEYQYFPGFQLPLLMLALLRPSAATRARFTVAYTLSHI